MITNYTKDEIQKNIDSETQIINSDLSIQINDSIEDAIKDNLKTIKRRFKK